MITIHLNGKSYELGEDTTIAKLLDEIGIPRPGTAVAVDGAIVPRERHDARILSDGETVDVLRAIGGG